MTFIEMMVMGFLIGGTDWMFCRALGLGDFWSLMVGAGGFFAGMCIYTILQAMANRRYRRRRAEPLLFLAALVALCFSGCVSVQTIQLTNESGRVLITTNAWPPPSPNNEWIEDRR